MSKLSRFDQERKKAACKTCHEPCRISDAEARGFIGTDATKRFLLNVLLPACKDNPCDHEVGCICGGF